MNFSEDERAILLKILSQEIASNEDFIKDVKGEERQAWKEENKVLRAIKSKVREE